MATEEKYSTTILSVDHAKIGIVRTSQITSKAVKTIKIKFEFRSTEWQSMTKTAVFIKEENDYLCSTGDQVVKHVPLDQSNECFIPTEVIQDQGCFSVGVYGTYGNEMLPTNLVKLKYHMGCYSDGTAPSAPTQSVYEQIMTALSLKATKSELNDYAKKNEIGQYIPDTYATKEYVNTYGGKIDKIQVNGTEQSITNKTVNISVPTKVSQLNNDSGYLTSFTETDPTVPSWAKQATKPTYTATEVGALPNDTVIPTKTSDLTNDSGFITQHQDISGKADCIDGTVLSYNADFAEIGEWSDGNPNNENRLGYFVSVDKTEAGITMLKATSTSDVRGVTMESPGFAANATTDKFDSDGNLLSKYSYVGFAGFVPVIDNGTCTVNGRCVSANDGTAIPSPNTMGYQIIDRIDDTHVLILVEPSADMLVRIKDDMDNMATQASFNEGTFSFKNALGVEQFTVQIPIYNGEEL